MAILSIVSPVYKTGSMIEPLLKELAVSLAVITEDFEIILVDDGSPDDAWAHIQRACAAFPKVKGIKLSRNFGQHYAITAGLDQCSGEWIVVMDSDLQDRPEEISRLFEEAIKGFDIVIAKRQSR